jgi:cold shock protein
MRARVKMFNCERGFGFVVIEGRPDAYVHRTVLGSNGDETLQVGELVDVEVEEAPRGPRVIWLDRVES